MDTIIQGSKQKKKKVLGKLISMIAKQVIAVAHKAPKKSKSVTNETPNEPQQSTPVEHSGTRKEADGSQPDAKKENKPNKTAKEGDEDRKSKDSKGSGGSRFAALLGRAALRMGWSVPMIQDFIASHREGLISVKADSADLMDEEAVEIIMAYLESEEPAKGEDEGADELDQLAKESVKAYQAAKKKTETGRKKVSGTKRGRSTPSDTSSVDSSDSEDAGLTVVKSKKFTSSDRDESALHEMAESAASRIIAVPGKKDFFKGDPKWRVSLSTYDLHATVREFINDSEETRDLWLDFRDKNRGGARATKGSLRLERLATIVAMINFCDACSRAHKTPDGDVIRSIGDRVAKIIMGQQRHSPEVLASLIASVSASTNSKQGTKQGKNAKPPKRNNANPKKNDSKCWICDKPGHTKKNCPDAKKGK